MQRFAQTCEAVASTTKKLEKVRLVAEYLRSLPIDESPFAALFFTGRAFPRNQEQVLSVGGALLWDAVAEIAGADPAAMQAAYRLHGDLGSATEELLGGRKSSGGLTLSRLAEIFADLARRRGPSQKSPVLRELFRKTSGLEAKYIVKIITGDLRIGLKESLVEEAIARAFGQPLSAVSRANMLTGDISETLRMAAAGTLHEARLRLFQPIGFMLASPADTAAEVAGNFPAGAWVEDKFDGIRAQAHKSSHKSSSRVELYSRTLDRITEFPELHAPLQALPGEFVLDGEIVAWRDGRALPFTEFQKRLGRKRSQRTLWDDEAIPVRYFVFDLLYLNGETLLDQPLSARRERLTELLAHALEPVELVASMPCNSEEAVQEIFESSFQRGNEGIMAKAPQSAYTPGRRGKNWMKLKRPLATLDVVVTAAEYGHGKRHQVLSDYTFAVRNGRSLVNIGKAYSGLTDAEIVELTEYFKEHTVEDQGFRRLVEPTVVLEVAFNNIQRSARHNSGFALRFPRIVRRRMDKPASEIDTVERVEQLFELQHALKRDDEPTS